MLVGKRRRMLRYLERNDLERYRALVADLGLRPMIAAGDAGPRLHAARPGRRGGLARRLQRPQGPARLLPARLQPGLLRPALGLPGGQAGDRGEGRRAGRHQRRPPLRPQGLPGEARDRHPAALRLRAQGRGRRAYGSYLDGAGIANRTLVLIDEDGKVAWAYESPTPGEFPGANLIFDALA